MSEHIVDKDGIINAMLGYNFEILSMDSTSDNESTLIIKHDLHPEGEIRIIFHMLPEGEGEEGEESGEVMNLTFEGPDDYTEDEAQTVLQEVSNFLVEAIEAAVAKTAIGDKDSTIDEQ